MISKKKKYNEAAQWIKSKDDKFISLNRKEVSIQDSYLGPHEDFSNNVELFLFQKESLSKSPELIKLLENLIQ